MTRKIALEEHFLVEGFANIGRTEGSGPAAAFRRQAAEDEADHTAPQANGPPA